VITSASQIGTFGAVASLWTITLYQGNHDRSDQPWYIAPTERYVFHMQVLLKCC
jgi:hypothetical protein